ncbi:MULTISPECIES: hypothetical protein [unclassified Collinsella]|uniref:hypothetical protein n=1 Tax=unclassified Collinsella TaxID=2637548 RepID=UPI0012B2258D|nr:MULTISPECIES: hypothetical protein [unclassified Collinsella]MSS25189.1 hypothetical protein [Collinsella sp. WCA1-178-WT-3 (M2)]MSS51574.1 hypothetical protein [Collinsella sp. WCA1-178-WT-3 (M1)]
MRDYNLMRNMLVFISNDGERALNDLCHFGDVRSVGKELSRLREEGLIDSDMSFDPEYNGGRVRGLTAEGRAFVRDIENDIVWELIRKTLDGSGLDLSYPLLKKVCETIVEHYVMSKIPEI